MSLLAAPGIPAGSSPARRIASAIDTPSASRIRSGSSGPIAPTRAREPQKFAAWNRLASSSQSETASIVRRGRPNRSPSVRTATSAAITPSAPS